MELENLQNINQLDFFPAVPVIKQEQSERLDENSSNSANPCDSVEKQVGQATSTPNETIPTKCVWCGQVLTPNDHPKLLECLHVACGQCINTKFTEVDRTMPPIIHCPLCNMASQNDFIIDNQFLIESINSSDDNQSLEGDKSSAQVKCSNCSDEATATSWCVDCSEFICDNCVQAHLRLKITKDHTIKPKDEANCDLQNNNNNANRSLMCSTHPQEKLSLFCETCDKLTCRDCQLANHRDHKYKFAHEIATETRNQLTSLLSDINYKRFLLTSAKKVIDDRQNLIMERKKDMIKDITAMVVKITNTVNARGKQLAMRVNEVCDAKLKVLCEKKEALQLLSDNTDHCIDFVSNALEKGSDGAVLYSKKSLSRHLQKLKCQRADIPNPEIPVRLNIQLNQVSELQKVISQMGTILVDGKPYPSQPQLNVPPRQAVSPNMAPPLRPGLQPPALQQIPSGHQPPVPTNNYQNGSPYHNAPSQPFNSMQMNRQYPNDAQRMNGYPGMGPGSMQRQPGQPLVSSSTHPQNIVNQNPNHMGFGNPSMQQNGPSPPNIQHQMRQHFMSGNPVQNPNHQCQNFQQNQVGPNGPPGAFMNSGPRFQNFQRMTPNHLQGMSGTSPISNNVAGPIRPMMQNSMGYGVPQNTYNQGGQTNQPINVQMGLSMPNTANHSVGAKWHIPQSAQQDSGAVCIQQNPLLQFPNGQQRENFKISLKSPNTIKNTTPPATTPNPSVQPSILPNVTSTNPKTPSPSTNDASKDFTEPIDKVREDSINDLMATIAKLDSNGVQVLAEGRNKTTSPQVHSSTDLTNTQEEKHDMKDDPNEDWCAVCLDGGELMCCDKCPKVFHQSCHIPAISSLPDESETWQCLLCVNMEALTAQAEQKVNNTGELLPCELKIIQRICLELYCQYEQSLPFREPEPQSNTSYYEIVCNPISLDEIRSRLDPHKPNHYKDIGSFVRDVRLLFKNVHLFYQEDSKTFTKARYLESFFDEQLRKWLPKHTNTKSSEGSNNETTSNEESSAKITERTYDDGNGTNRNENVPNNTKDRNCSEEPPQKKSKV
ncbi:E3 ubiquitin-protein ligase TRIM33 [Condylostylus longicornis]|uniref:E3 ubiquitin-protein ligase TRIM33 n=1 Tax=Condylostylus longicornis TaxID=2530218 RepID=UPI00244DCFEA|nr:E3 ubiquitin-protein ligase TRIM33 [Condylostylus longicornis]